MPSPFPGMDPFLDDSEYWHDAHVMLIDLRDPLPEINIPLTPEHPDVLFSLKAAFERLYDDGSFRREVDYNSEPVPRLKGSDARWADGLLRAQRLRSE